MELLKLDLHPQVWDGMLVWSWGKKGYWCKSPLSPRACSETVRWEWVYVKDKILYKSDRKVKYAPKSVLFTLWKPGFSLMPLVHGWPQSRITFKDESSVMHLILPA